MGFFSNLFKASEPKETKLLPWIAFTDLQQIQEIKEQSKNKTQVVFKHSTSCGISRMVLNRFVDAYSLTENDLDLYYLDLLSYRNISNEVGYTFQVMHESPQLLVIKNGVVVVHSSHGGVNTIDLNDFL
ncbi:MAG: bacillithiol system redox-active protein YtxJ [Chlorobi bacterium]|nr:bacillithiol system redox-active protein YtxJ [Chlorobiota bacterium]